MKYMKQQMDILPSLPVDAATIRALWGISMTAKNTKVFPYMEQLKELEKTIAARAPKGFEETLAEIHNYVYPPRLLQVGDEAVDAELLDMQGQKHHLFDAFSNGKYVLLDFWGIGCGPCMMSEPEDISSKYCDMGAIPYYVMISPDKRIIWKAVGYQPGYFLGMADALNGLKQDNSANLQFVIRNVDANVSRTVISFRYYAHKSSGFSIANGSYLTANGKKYKLIAADGITLDENHYTQVKASESTNEFLGNTYYSDFTLTFEPFDIIPTTFDYKEGDGEDVFVIRNISIE